MIIIDTERFDCVLELTLQTTMSGLLVIHIGRLQTYFINVIYSVTDRERVEFKNWRVRNIDTTPVFVATCLLFESL